MVLSHSDKYRQEVPETCVPDWRRPPCAAGDGNCAYRAMLIGILEAAMAANDNSRKVLAQQVDRLWYELPSWAKESRDGTTNAKFGHMLLKVWVTSCFSWFNSDY